MKRKEVSISSIPLIYVKRQQEHANGALFQKGLRPFLLRMLLTR
jgi:hypothetical protein